MKQDRLQRRLNGNVAPPFQVERVTGAGAVKMEAGAVNGIIPGVAANWNWCAMRTGKWKFQIVCVPCNLIGKVALTRSNEASSSLVKFAADTGNDV
jgi:hypothetical protein